MSNSRDCKLVRELCEKFQKAVAAYKEHRKESKQALEPPKPEEIEMETFWRPTTVRFTEPEERWSVIRQRQIQAAQRDRFVPAETKPINIVYPPRVQDW